MLLFVQEGKISLMTFFLFFSISYSASGQERFQTFFLKKHLGGGNCEVTYDINDGNEIDAKPVNPIFYYFYEGIYHYEQIKYDTLRKVDSRMSHVLALNILQEVVRKGKLKELTGDNYIRQQIRKKKLYDSGCSVSRNFLETIRNKSESLKQEVETYKREKEKELENLKTEWESVVRNIGQLEDDKTKLVSRKNELDSIRTTLTIRQTHINKQHEEFTSFLRESFSNEEYKLLANSKIKINVKVNTNDNKVYVDFSNYALGVACTKEIKINTMAVVSYLLNDINRKKIKGKKPTVEIHFFGFADGVGGENLFGKLNGEEVYQLRNRTSKLRKFTSHGPLNDSSYVEGIVNRNVFTYKEAPQGKRDIRDELDSTSDRLSNRILGYKRAYCSCDTTKKYIENKGLNSVVDFKYSLYSVRFAKMDEYKGGMFRSVKLDIDLDGVFEHYDQEISSVSKQIDDIDEELKKARQKKGEIDDDIIELNNYLEKIKQADRDADPNNPSGEVYKKTQEILGQIR